MAVSVVSEQCEDFAEFKYVHKNILCNCTYADKRGKNLKSWALNQKIATNISNCDGFGLIHRLIKLVEATNLEHGSQDGADGGDTELNGGGGSEMEDLRYYV